MIRFQCQHCGVKIKGDDKYAGTTVRCPDCKKEFTVPKTPQPVIPKATPTPSAPPDAPQKKPGNRMLLIVAGCGVVIAGASLYVAYSVATKDAAAAAKDTVEATKDAAARPEETVTQKTATRPEEEKKDSKLVEYLRLEQEEREALRKTEDKYEQAWEDYAPEHVARVRERKAIPSQLKQAKRDIKRVPIDYSLALAEFSRLAESQRFTEATKHLADAGAKKHEDTIALEDEIERLEDRLTSIESDQSTSVEYKRKEEAWLECSEATVVYKALLDRISSQYPEHAERLMAEYEASEDVGVQRLEKAIKDAEANYEDREN